VIINDALPFQTPATARRETITQLFAQDQSEERTKGMSPTLHQTFNAVESVSSRLFTRFIPIAAAD
jgi:hypothetical protein